MNNSPADIRHELCRSPPFADKTVIILGTMIILNDNSSRSPVSFKNYPRTSVPGSRCRWYFCGQVDSGAPGLLMTWLYSIRWTMTRIYYTVKSSHVVDGLTKGARQKREQVRWYQHQTYRQLVVISVALYILQYSKLPCCKRFWIPCIGAFEQNQKHPKYYAVPSPRYL